ncbi:MAG: ATPase, T2SS/T4P/T4SS family [Clostridia bacterium]
MEETLNAFLRKGIKLGATDIHLAPDQLPVYRVKRKLFFDQARLPISKVTLNEVLEYFYSVNRGLEEKFLQKKQADVSYTLMEHRFRINISITKGVPTFSIRIIPNGIIDVSDLGLIDVINKMKKINSGLILLTGKVNSGKSTTMNAFIQEINREVSKKIVTLEDPIEYEHKSDKSIIIQKEIGDESDVISYYNGLINLLREDSDISVLGEIRDKKTMDVALDLAESGGLILGTLHTRSCGETIERIISMYDPSDQNTIKNSVSSVLKMVVSQKLLVSTKSELLMVPEVMIVNNTLAAQIRQEKFNVADIEDTIHAQRDLGCVSFEYSFSDLYIRGLLSMDTIKQNVNPERLNIIKSLILNNGSTIDE